jgi:hypothetical protein
MAGAAKKHTSSTSHSGSTKSSKSESHAKGGSHAKTESHSKAGSHAKSHPGSKARESTHKSSGRHAGKVEGAGQPTTDHEQIRTWVEERGGKPACVRGTGDKNDIGMLRIDMPGYTGEDKLEPISWDEWFGKFEEKALAFLYQDETKGGTKSNFNKLVSRDNAK